MLKYYAGIGSRQTPVELEPLIRHIAMVNFYRGFTLRSGGADGADTMFEKGLDEIPNEPGSPLRKQIFLPWKGFNRNPSPLYEPWPEALELASKLHPRWDRCSDAARKMHARNAHQVLGIDLKTPAEFIVCWTPNGDFVGGTAMALRIARHRHIQIFNLSSLHDREFWQQQRIP